MTVSGNSTAETSISFSNSIMTGNTALSVTEGQGAGAVAVLVGGEVLTGGTNVTLLNCSFNANACEGMAFGLLSPLCCIYSYA